METVEYDQEMKLLCQEDYTISKFYSTFSKHHWDRRWTLQCSKSPVNLRPFSNQVQTSTLYNNHKPFVYLCPNRAPIVGE